MRATVIQAVKRAEKLVLDRIDNFGQVQTKSPKDFVTQVDKEAERLIVQTIQAQIPNAAFLGEEGGRQGEGEYLFVIDPLDATTNYIKNIPLFDISVAVYKNDQNILGVIACPKFGEVYVAEKGKGAYLNGERIQVSSTGDISQAVIAYNRSHHPPEILESSKRVLAAMLDQAASFRVFGTGGLDYCFLARGSFDACITPLAEPFHSAGYIIMEEAGAKVTDYDGNPHSLKSKTIIAANPTLYPQVFDLVKSSSL